MKQMSGPRAMSRLVAPIPSNRLSYRAGSIASITNIGSRASLQYATPTTTPICTRSSARSVSTARHRTDSSTYFQKWVVHSIFRRWIGAAGKSSDEPLRKGARPKVRASVGSRRGLIFDRPDWLPRPVIGSQGRSPGVGTKGTVSKETVAQLFAHPAPLSCLRWLD